MLGFGACDEGQGCSDLPLKIASGSGEDTRFCSLGMRSSSKTACVLAGSGTRVWGARRIGRTF